MSLFSAKNWRLPARRSEIKDPEERQPLLDLLAEAAEKKKALDIKVLDVRKTSSIVDYLVICSGESSPQIRAIEKGIDESLREHKYKNYKWEGEANSGWVVLDLGTVVVHVLGSAQRDYYRLEELWGKEAVVYYY